MAEELNIITSDTNSVSVNMEDRIVTITNQNDTTNVNVSTTETKTIQVITAGPQGRPGTNGIGSLDTGSFITYLQTGSMSVATASYINPLFISASATYYGFGSGSINIDTSSFATTGSNSFNGNQYITGSLNTTNPIVINTNTVGDSISGTDWLKINANGTIFGFSDNGTSEQGYISVTNGIVTGFGAHVNNTDGMVFGSYSSHPVTLRTGNVNRVVIGVDGSTTFNNGITGSLFGTASLAFDIINKPFLLNQTSDANIIRTNENIFNHGDLLIHSENTLIIEDGAEYFILGNLINSGSIIVSGSLIVHGIIYNVGSIVGPGPVLSNNVLVTYDKANVPYGFTQLDGNSNLSISGSLNVNVGITGSLYDEAFSKNRTTNNSINFIKQYQSIFNPSNLFIQENDIFIVEENGEYYVLGNVINSGSIVVDGTFKIGGALLNMGTITGTGIIE